LNVDRPRARTQPGRNTCSAPVIPISTNSHAMPAGMSSTTSTTRFDTVTQATSEPANSTAATTSTWLADSRATTHGSTAAPSTAPSPRLPSSSPKPVEPESSNWSATTGSSAQSTAPGSTNSSTRSSIRRTTGELRT